MKSLFTLSVVLVLAASVGAQGVIDFETIPGTVPSDGLPISNQFQATHGVTFALANGGTPVLAQAGPPRTAFQGHNLLDDEPEPSTGAGQFFLTDDGILAGLPSTLIVNYTTPVSAATGVILDIDGSEEWTIEAIDAAGNILDTVVLGPNNSIDGSATTWSFNLTTATISHIHISFTGFFNVNVGLAFDLFNSSAITPGTGQANGPDARLEVDGVGQGNGNGPHQVVVGANTSMTLHWEGPPNAPFILAAGPPNPANTVLACPGTIDIGTPPLYGDVTILLDGTTPPGNALWRLDVNGVADQTISLPNVPPGPLMAVQGFVFQPSGCPVIATAAFYISVL